MVAWYIKQYKVVSITNTTTLKPGMWLEPDYVEQICKLAQKPGSDWSVQCVDNDLAQELTGAAVSAVSKAIPLPTL